MKDMAFDWYNLWKNNNDFIFSDRVVSGMDLFDNSMAKFNSKSILKRFLDKFPTHFEKNAKLRLNGSAKWSWNGL